MARTTIRTEDITAGEVTAANLADGVVDTSVIENNIALLAFQVASGDSITKFGMVDQVIDGFSDSSGVDTTNSTGEFITGKTASGSTTGSPWGDSSDGALSTSGNVTYVVPNKNGSYDGDMVVKQYSSVTVAAGHTVTVDQPCRGLVWLVNGDVSISGSVTMTGMGAAADPTSTSAWNAAGSDNNVVEATGLRFAYPTDTGSSSFTQYAGTGMNGVGTTARNAFRAIPDVTNATIYQVLRAGSAGAAGQSGTSNGAAGTAGTSTGDADARAVGFPGGGGGASFAGGTSGNGSAGFVFAGGSAGGAIVSGVAPSSGSIDATLYGAGGNAGGGPGNNDSGGGGAGIPGGSGQAGGSAGQNGCGGLLIIIAKGNITVNSGGSIYSKGTNGGNSHGTGDAGGGGSGGGVVMNLCGGTATNNGTISVVGGSGGTGAGNGNVDGGAGGAGVMLADSTLDGTWTGNIQGDMTLISNTTTAEATATTADLVFLLEDSAGSSTLGTDVNAYVSRNGNANYSTALTLVDEGDWGTNKRIVTARNVDISGLTGTTAMRYKITTHNQSAVKVAKLHGVSLAWS